MLQEDFKNILCHIASGICIITTEYNQSLWGFTANSFVSVSLDPQLILFCLNKNAGSYLAFTQSSKFVVNFLSSTQKEIAEIFATRRKDKFSSVQYVLSKKCNCPVITQCLAYIECNAYAQYEAGDHTIIIAQVTHGIVDKTKSPLLYYNRKYYFMDKN
jgi:flavin reductase (DIM6/NTAB) family NADH-FMN oxidoreductase RutF